jgi:hypothetical protein
MSEEKKTRVVRPWDLLNPKSERAPEHVQRERLSFCNSCPLLHPITKTCASCGCFMAQKVKLAYSTCPKGKWSIYIEEENN